MTGGERGRLLGAARTLGAGRFNDFIRAVPEVRRRGRLRYWRGQFLTGLPGRGEFVAVFAGAEPLPVPLPEPLPPRDRFGFPSAADGDDIPF